MPTSDQYGGLSEEPWPDRIINYDGEFTLMHVATRKYALLIPSTVCGLLKCVEFSMGNNKRRENRAGILVSVSVEENEVVVDNLDAARSHTYLSATCVHGECTDDPYAWCNDGIARIRGGLSQKGLAQTRRGVGGLFFFVGQFHAWNTKVIIRSGENLVN
ncbi:Uncharacterized protein DBV15_01708 [Temnothorax longispinosus]|uniref:Uncharacterized protein n=1 Tax=Temnothorax longispinosus TaxID=300112 RepID=A0A4S2L6D3_9HYME|nr:Uncharacterized protein DBV15_01708 [Temnothorax longispinosus]